MSPIAIQIDRVSKKFCRSMSKSLVYGAVDSARRIVGASRPDTLRTDEFWALEDVSAAVAAGECLGLIGPNGAGKSTLLKLVNRELRPERGAIAVRGGVKSLIRLGSGLLPMLTGRENIYIKCSESGLGKRDADAKLDDILAFTDLSKALDAPVRHYSDGMYARLEFGIATCVPMDVLLIDEVLAVGDIAFQLRCLERLNELKRQGTAILFVSHSEMNIRTVADRCLLLFDGRTLGLGSPDALLYKYYDAIGYLNRHLKPLGALPEMPDDFGGAALIERLEARGGEQGAATLRVEPGGTLEWRLHYRISELQPAMELVLQFWNSAGVLVATLDNRRLGIPFAAHRRAGALDLRIPFLPLAPGLYRIAGGIASDHRFLGYRRELATLHVMQPGYSRYGGLALVPAELAHGAPSRREVSDNAAARPSRNDPEPR